MCQKIVEEYGYTHLSAGELLRLEQNTANSPHGELIEKHMVSGTIVPVAINNCIEHLRNNFQGA